VFNSFVMMTEHTLSISVPIMFYKVIFGENHNFTKIPCENLSFTRLSGRIKALCIKSTENLPLSCRFQKLIRHLL
jgi:hypothetical protein